MIEFILNFNLLLQLPPVVVTTISKDAHMDLRVFWLIYVITSEQNCTIVFLYIEEIRIFI